MPAKLLDEVKDGEEVLIKRKDGPYYSIEKAGKPLEAAEWPGVYTGVSRDQIISAVRESREK